jgi:two-component system OmpR family response regulator
MQSSQCRILLVEDHADTRELLVLFLSDCGYGVKTATTLSEAVKLLQAEDFSLLIFDSRLPGGSGVDLCRSVRQFDQSTPIVFSSGLAYEKDKRQALDAGAQAYFVKPIDLTDLMKSVENLILKDKKFPVGDDSPIKAESKREFRSRSTQAH